MSDKIVCLDDYEPGLITRQAALEHNGYEVVTTSDANLGMNLCLTPSVKLLIVDYTMPKISGAEVAERVRRSRPDLPIIMLSGATLSKPVPCVDRFISKDTPWEEILRQIRELLGERGHEIGNQKE